MTAFSDLSPACRHLWAKSGDGSGHGLLAHMLDVAAVALAILNRESPGSRIWIARNLGLPVETVDRWVAALVGLHDFGKAIAGFQAKWPDGRLAAEVAGLTFPAHSLQPSDHGAASAALLRPLLADKAGDPAWCNAVLQAISAHHGYNLPPAQLRNARPRHEPAIWGTARTELFDAYWRTVAPADKPACGELLLPAVQWLAGLTSTADWIGSNIEWFEPGERADGLANHFDQALNLAESALDTIGWPHHHTLLNRDADTDTLLHRILARPDASIRARPLQSAADVLLRNAEGPTLMIVEAPMGEGKTELAMLAHLRLQAANQHRGLYVALPTKATGNAMFSRTLTFLRSFTDHIRLDIQLAHGSAAFDDQIAHLRGIHGDPGDNVGSSAWFSQRRRALISPYGVGTIDQALFATLNIKHHFVRLWGLANRVVVLDEVHAYDTYTSGLIAALLRWLKALNCSVVLMSATLPGKRRQELLAAWDIEAHQFSQVDYPRVLVTYNDRIACHTVDSRPLPPIQVSGIPEDLSNLAACALDQLAGGGCGAIVVNTVDRAQRLFRLIQDEAPSGTRLLLYHARFPADERGEREREVLSCFGHGADRPACALLIATQVAEQSLDIDFDFLISDLAPIDLLLQRAGRLHRHERDRPAAHSVPRLMVSGLLAGRFPELKETAWEYVYDPYILARTWALIAEESVWTLPEDIDRLVQRVYDEDIPLPADLQAETRRRIEEIAYGEHLAKIQQESLLALHAAIDADAEPQSAYANKPRGNEEGEGLGIRNRTRLGEDAIGAVPIEIGDDGWRLAPDSAPFDPQEVVSDTLARRIFLRQLQISRRAVVADLLSLEVPRCFADHPLLRNLRPLLLTDGATQIGNTTVRLDPELGLVYQNNAESHD